MYCPAKYHLSWYCQTWKSIKVLLQGVTKKAWTVEGQKARKICFPLPCAFHFRQTVCHPNYAALGCKLCYQTSL